MFSHSSLDKCQFSKLSRLVRVKARRFAAPASPGDGDTGDLEQAVLLRALRALGQFDSSRAGLNTFLTRVVDNALADERRRWQAARRRPSHRLRFLQEPLKDGDGRPCELV